MTRLALPRVLRVASFRFAAFYVAVFAASAFVLGVAVFAEARSVLQEQMRARIETETAYLKEEFASGGIARLVATVRARERGPGALDYVVQDSRGTALAGEIPGRSGLAPGWTTMTVPSERDDAGEPERVRALISRLPGDLLLAVGSDLRQIDDFEEAVATAFLWTVGLVAALGIGGGVLLSHAFLRRVDAIARTAEAIIAGDLGRRVPTRGTGDDLDRLAGTLNLMLDRIATLMDSLRLVSSDVAHDLRTPLSRLYQRLEDARAHASSVAEYEAATEAAINEAHGLLETFAALLRIAQVEGASSRAGFKTVDLSALAETVADAYRPDAEEAEHQLVTSIDAGIAVCGDKELLTQALANLVENAIRHTPAGTCFGLSVRRARNGGPILTVWDEGPGVAGADLPLLINRFFRAERSRSTPGNGLGLSLVAAVAELHGCDLIFEPGEPGLRVILRFPSSPR